MARLGFQEKMLWAQLVGVGLVIGFYAHILLRTPPGNHYFHAVLLGLLFLFGGVRILARRSSSVVEDERDREIAAMGASWSNMVLWIGLLVILVLYWDHGSMRSAGVLIGILFHLLVLAGAVRIVRELVAYRMAS